LARVRPINRATDHVDGSRRRSRINSESIAHRSRIVRASIPNRSRIDRVTRDAAFPSRDPIDREGHRAARAGATPRNCRARAFAEA
jgi:hypothetical protein